MLDFVTNIMPNVMEKSTELWTACLDTLYMLMISGIISLFFGLIFGVIMIVTRKGDILENKVIYYMIDKLINLFRSIPFVILIALLLPVTRAVMGTAIGKEGAIIPLVFGTVPFFARQIESALSEIDHGLIEASTAMGSSPVEIIFRVYLRESIPGIVRGTTITFVSLVGLTAMAGAVGAGGIGDFAIRYGYQRSMMDITYVSVIIILIFVTILQGIGNMIIKKMTH